MAQTSTRRKPSVGAGTRGRSSRSARASASSSGSSSTRNRQSRNGRGSNGRRSVASRSGRSRAATSPRKRRSPSSSSSGPADAVKEIGSRGKDTVAEGAHIGGKAISSVADKVKWPVVASGAALAGVAGGLALGAKHNSGGKVLGMRVGKGREAGKNLAETSRNIGKFSENVGQFAAEVRKTREAIEDGSKHSSPIEVVLRALTARR